MKKAKRNFSMKKIQTLSQLFDYLWIGNFYKGTILDKRWARIDLKNLDQEALMACNSSEEKSFCLKCTSFGKETHIIADRPISDFFNWHSKDVSCNDKDGKQMIFLKVILLDNQFLITTKYYIEEELVTSDLTIDEIVEKTRPASKLRLLRRSITRFFWPIFIWYHKRTYIVELPDYYLV